MANLPASGRPVIGITGMALELGGRLTDLAHRDYSQAVLEAGGTPLLIPVVAMDAGPVIQAIDGLLLTGGGDVEPSRSGEPTCPTTDGIDPARDTLEIAAVHQAIGDGVPVLGICRGCQVLNVGLGGSLVQDLASPTGLDHLVAEHRSEPVHVVEVVAGSRLDQALGLGPGDARAVPVNSVHHQGIARVAPVLEPVGSAPDGLVEALAHEVSPVLGVQWHPENLRDLWPHQRLFQWLVDQGRRRANRGGEDRW
jgi:putative glutamine amidotransferase